MVKITDIDSAKLVEAARIWSGWGGMAPSRDDARLIQQMGSTDANALLPVIKQLEGHFYSSDARYVASDLQEMAKLAKAHFVHAYPTAPAEIGEIFAWCYTFDFK